MRRNIQIASVLFVFVALLVILSLFLHSRVSNEKLELVTTKISDFTPALLRERSPILFHEQLVDPRKALEKLLRFQYFTSRKEDRAKRTTRALWTAFYWTSDSDESDEKRSINLEHSNGSDLTLRLRRDQVVLVPHSFSIATQGPFNSISFDDVWGFLHLVG